jgi:HEAT repeat protein
VHPPTPSRNSTKQRVVILLCAAGVCGAVWFLAVDSRPGDPVWQGKKLSQWLQEDNGRGPGNLTDDARAAIRGMGTNAIPYLLMMAKETDSKLKLQLRSRLSRLKIGFINRLIPRHNEDLFRAAAGFEALGRAGAPAVPELSAILDEGGLNSFQAVRALDAIGPPAIPALLRALTNQYRLTCSQASESLRLMPREANIPDLLHYLDDPDPMVRNYAINALPGIRLQPDAVVPKLKEQLGRPDLVVPKLMERLSDTNRSVRLNAAFAIGLFGPQAQKFNPKLTELQNDPNAGLREAASNAIIWVEAMSTNQASQLPSPPP